MTPLILITGFLGAGKTTLVRALLPRLTSKGIRPHVILNDYENAEVDAATFGAYSEFVRPIAGTCICCGSQDELMHELRNAPLSGESVMLLEANGTADATEIIEILTADWRASRYTLPVQVAVVDTERWQDRDRANGLERSQVQTAGYRVLTRSDQVRPDRLAAVHGSLMAVSPGGREVDPGALANVIAELRTISSSLPPRRFARGRKGADARGAEQTDRDEAQDHNVKHHFASLEISIPDAVHYLRFRELLESLPEDVLRVKGIARFIGLDDPVYFERGDRPTSVTFSPIPDRTNLDCVAVLIGGNLNATLLRAAFRAVECG